MADIDMNTFGGRLRHARMMAGMKSARILAEKISSATTTVSNWESNRHMPSKGDMERMADVLGITMAYLLGEAPYERKSSEPIFIPNPDKKVPLANNSRDIIELCLLISGGADLETEWQRGFLTGKVPPGQFAFVSQENWGRVRQGDYIGMVHRDPHEGDVVLVDTPDGPRLARWQEGMASLAVFEGFYSYSAD